MAIHPERIKGLAPDVAARLREAVILVLDENETDILKSKFSISGCMKSHKLPYLADVIFDCEGRVVKNRFAPIFGPMQVAKEPEPELDSTKFFPSTS